ncbi:hypothetical protein EDC40_105474 [Aminobacter aminovorans]|uniref:Uncharacterized protein n=1 Tax=Aminobacter aminovorans TaxID=83263 RepID=A0A380WMJ6_AMIAI|nr:hypothetical protein EDC40_105474 [Aminobacter aminovorans]SUU90070.1 Uncharacterised protein [Aminobacter aminovorans]
MQLLRFAVRPLTFPPDGSRNFHGATEFRHGLPHPDFRLLSAFLALGTALPAVAQGVSVTDLAGKTHIHGLAFDRADGSSALIATHHGPMKAAPDGSVTPTSESQDDFMCFTPHPTDAKILFASGHPKDLGFIKSDDSGMIDLAVSPAPPL